MATALKIKDVADATGFSITTLRYYEQIGLLPERPRTPAGYRVYDQATLDRLGFIARAKRLGCTLEEITALAKVWDGGECEPLQEQLRRLVAAKIDAAHDQIAELATFTAELQRAATALERHRPRGACDDECGCIGEPGALASTVQAISLSPTPTASAQQAVACTLPTGAIRGRIADWRQLLVHADRRERIAHGVRTVFTASVPTDQLVGLALAEQRCCPFFRLAITVDRRGVALEVSGPDAALPIIEAMFGAP